MIIIKKKTHWYLPPRMSKVWHYSKPLTDSNSKRDWTNIYVFTWETIRSCAIVCDRTTNEGKPQKQSPTKSPRFRHGPGTQNEEITWAIEHYDGDKITCPSWALLKASCHILCHEDMVQIWTDMIWIYFCTVFIICMTIFDCLFWR
jgi:hypothetical protein